jgi:hypothetical protein
MLVLERHNRQLNLLRAGDFTVRWARLECVQKQLDKQCLRRLPMTLLTLLDAFRHQRRLHFC